MIQQPCDIDIRQRTVRERHRKHRNLRCADRRQAGIQYPQRRVGQFLFRRTGFREQRTLDQCQVSRAESAVRIHVTGLRILNRLLTQQICGNLLRITGIEERIRVDIVKHTGALRRIRRLLGVEIRVCIRDNSEIVIKPESQRPVVRKRQLFIRNDVIHRACCAGFCPQRTVQCVFVDVRLQEFRAQCQSGIPAVILFGGIAGQIRNRELPVLIDGNIVIKAGGQTGCFQLILNCMQDGGVSVRQAETVLIVPDISVCLLRIICFQNGCRGFCIRGGICVKEGGIPAQDIGIQIQRRAHFGVCGCIKKTLRIEKLIICG